MEFTKDDYLKLTDSDKLELLEFVIDDIRLKDIDNPIKEINFNYFNVCFIFVNFNSFV